MNAATVAHYKSLHKGLFWGSITAPLFLFWLPTVGAPLALVVLAWFLLGFRVVGTKERWVITMFDDPYATAESGLRWLPFLISTAKVFPTVPTQLDFPDEVLILTKSGTFEGQAYGTMVLRGVISFMFRYPEGDGLLRAAKFLPNPKDETAMMNYFQEPVFEEVRTSGGDMIYAELLRKRGDFAEKVLTALTSKDGVVKMLVDESGIVNPRVIIKEMDPPEGVMGALHAEEEARLRGAATRVTAAAEADRERTLGKGKGDAKKSEGEGVRDAQKMLYDMIREHPENMRIRALYTLSEMAQGPATTIFPIPTDLVGDLRQVFGKPSSVFDVEKVWETIPQALKDKLMKQVLETLKPETQQ